MLSRKTILLVEDNPDDEMLTVRALRKNNIADNVIVKRDGQEALDYLFSPDGVQDEKCISRPRVILLDLKLPKIDGLEVLKEIRQHERTRYIPVVILTSSKEDLDLQAGYKLGANSYVRKPVDFQQFIELAKHLGLYWLRINELPYG